MKKSELAAALRNLEDDLIELWALCNKLNGRLRELERVPLPHTHNTYDDRGRASACTPDEQQQIRDLIAGDDL